MANNPTILMSSLDDSQMKQSIANLVANVKRATRTMTNDFDSAVDHINAKLKELGNGKNISAKGGVSANATSTKQETDAIEKHTEAIKKNTEAKKKNAQVASGKPVTFDQMAQAQQTIAAPKSARDSYLAFMRGYKEQAQMIEKQIADIERALHTSVAKRVAGLNVQMDEAKRRLNELQSMKTIAQSYDGSGLKANTSKIDSQIEAQMRRIADIQNRINNASADLLRKRSELQLEHSRISNIMKDEYATTQQTVAATQQQVVAARSYSDVLDRQIKSVTSAKTAREAFANVISMPSGDFNQAKTQMEALVALKEKISSIPALPKKSQFIADIEGAINRLRLNYEQFSETAVSAIKKTENETKNLTEQTKKLTEQTKELTSTLSEKAQKNAQRVRDYFARNPEDKRLDVIDRTMKENGTLGYVYRENDARAKGLSIEQQLLQLYTAQAQSQQQATAQKESSLRTEQQITEEVKKRKAYQSPTLRQSDYYQAAVAGTANKLGIKGNEVGLGDATVSTINELSKALKQAQEAYAKLSAEERNAPIGKAMRLRLQEIERDLQKTRKEMSRPIDLKSALSGSEKTLDDIAYKMQRLRAYKQGIDPVRRGADTEIRQINNELARLQKTADNWMGKQQEMIKGNTALGRSWNYMKNRLAFYLTVGATTQFVRQLVDIRSQYEMNERALGILIDSAERGTRIFNELSQMSLVSPYTLIELTTAAKQLSAYDIAAKDVVDTTRRLADMASAVGIPIERLTYALGQIKAYGYLNSRDARMFSNAGIPLVKQLSEYYTQLEGRLVSTADVYDRIKKKTVDFEEVVNVIHHMTDEGGKFFDFQAKMADTLKVRLANLQLAWNNMLNDIGEESEGVIRGGIGVLRDLFANWKDIKHYVDEAVVVFGAYKVAQLLIVQTTGVAARSMTSEILAMKRTEVELLRKKALTQELTASEKAMIATSKVVTATDYQNALSTKNLTKQKALLLAAFNMNNKKMLEALIRMGLLTSAEIRSMTVGRALTLVFKSMGLAISSAARAIGAFLASNWVFILLGAAFELYHAFDSASEHIKDINKGLIEDAKNTYKDLKDFLESVEPVRIKIKAGKLEDSEAQKAWDDLRERLETLSANSAIYISKLMGQDDMTQRLKEGYEYAEMLQKVQGIIEGFGDEDIKGTETIWGGFFGEGLKDDIKDFLDVADELVKKYGSIGDAQEELSRRSAAGKGVGGALADLYEMNKEVKESVSSILNKSIEENLNIDEQRELFEKAIKKIATESKLSATETRVFRINSEKLYFKELEKLYIKDTQHRYNIDIEGAEREFAANKALQQEFFTWLSEVHSSETQKRISNASEEEIKNGDWLTKENKRWIQERAKEFSDKYKVSFGELNSLVQQANTWSIYIPVYFPTAKDSLSEFQKDFYKRAKETFKQDQATAKQVFAGILPEKDDAFPKWVKARQDEIKQLGEDRKKYERDETEWSKQHVKDIDEQIKHNKEALDLYHQPYEEPKDKKKKKEKDPILEALKLEISLVEKLRGDYEKLTKAGESQAGALATIHDAYGKTIKQLNAELKSFKLPQLDIAKIITGKDPKKQLDHFQKTLDSLIKNGLLNIERSKEVEAVLEKLKVSAKEYDFTELSKDIEKELNKLKESFDLGTALDAEPQLGNLFAKMYGFDTKELPRTFTELVQKAQSIIDNAFKGRGEARIDVSAILDKKAFEEWVKGTERELDSSLVQTVQKMRDYLVETQRKMISDTSKTYDKLLERYSEYQFKLIKIDKDSAADRLALIRKFAKEQDFLYVRDAAEIANEITLSTDPEERERLSKELQDIVKKIADGNSAVIQIGIGIDNKEAEEKAQVAFDEFTKNPIWRTAIGDLEGMTHDALRMLIKDLEDFIKTNKKLTTKQIRQIEGAITKLHKQIRKNNPFAAISDAIEEAENRTKEYEDAIKKAYEEIDALLAIPEHERTADNEERLEHLLALVEKLTKEKKKVGEIDMGVIFGDVNDVVSSISSITSEVTKLLDAIGGTQATEASKTISNIMGNLEAAGKGAQIGASFGGYGAAIGAVVGGLTDLATRLANEWSGNEDINKAIERSVRSVKRLEMAYANLEHQMKESYGEGELYAKKLLVANKKVQLAELQKQLMLEQSRKNKNRDYDKELDLQQQINDLTNELNDDIKDIVNSLLGISSVKDAAATLVDSMIDAFKSGEDYMQKFADSFEDMIDNMIVQAVMGRLISDKVQEIVDFVNSKVNVDTEALLNERAENEMAMKDLERGINIVSRLSPKTADALSEEYDALKKRNDEIERLMQSGSQITPEIVEEARKLAQDMKDETKYEFDLLMDMFGIKFGQDMNLSNLQQGIQSITEDTAGALEAITSGMYQQISLQSTLMTEIRDAVVSWDMEAQLGVQSQMLLQLQNSYQVQMTIQNIMQGWSSPNGMSVRVELAS